MDGWGGASSSIDARRERLPCHAAHDSRCSTFERARAPAGEDLARLAGCSTRFRGTDWMPEPCRSCDRREIDFGGCRCQAFLLTGDAAARTPSATSPPTTRS